MVLDQLKCVLKTLYREGDYFWWRHLVAEFGTNASGAIWRHLLANFGTYASGAILWPNLQLILIALHQISK